MLHLQIYTFIRAFFFQASVSPALRVFAHGNPQAAIEELRNKVLSLVEEARSLQALAEAEKRDMSENEQRDFDNILDTVDSIKAEIARRERLADHEASLAVVQPRQTTPQDVEVAQPQAAAPAKQNAVARRNITGGEQAGVVRGAWGWRSFGEFAQGVIRAVRGSVDPRLVAAAPSTYSNEGVGADGGFLVPPDFRQEIMQKVAGEDSLLSRTDQQVSSSNQMSMPIDETTPWQSTGGIQAYWEGEGHQKAQSKIVLNTETIKLNKIAALVPVTDELLEDANAIQAYLRRKAPEKINYKINEAIIRGTGVGMPMGILNSPALITVAAEGGQTAGTINFLNIMKMWSRMPAANRQRAVWIGNQDVDLQLQTTSFPGTGTAVPAYMPPGGLRDTPYSMLLGRPIIATEATSEIGAVGDLILADMSQYLTLVKAGGIKTDVSIHLWFDFDVTAFRFVMRVGGQPLWRTPISRRAGSNTLSPFVALAARA